MAKDPDTTPLRGLDPNTGPLRRHDPDTTPTRAAAAPAKPPHSAEGAVALFRIHLFPIGHLPQPRTEPLRQLPEPESAADPAAGTRFPPRDHPEARLVDTTRRAPLRRADGQARRPVRGTAVDGDTAEWARRYLVREEPAEYAWPQPDRQPEGEPVVLEPGTLLDRFGTEHGRVFGVPDASFAARSLPPEHYEAGYRCYRVLAPLPVWHATSAPWFDLPGGAPRYRATHGAAELVALGYLEPTAAEVEAQ